MRRLPTGSLGSGGLAFSLGILGVLWAPWLLPWSGLGCGLAVALFAPSRLRWPLLCLLLGAAWALLIAGDALESRWPAARHGEDVALRGTVIGIPESRGDDWRFRLRPADEAFNGDIRVSWYRAERAVQAGDCLQATLRMRNPRGSVSPGAFDYERWLLAQRYVATAYIRDAAFCTRSDRAWWRDARSELDRRLGDWLAGHPGLPLLRALMVGNRQGITDDDWHALRVTGTSHLLAISGLHVGLVAGLFLFLGRWAWRRSARLCAWLPAPRAGVLLGSLAALGYAALAGFAVPTQRALLMWAVLALALWSARPVRPARVLLLAWLAVLIVDPLAVLSAGSWLSFIAVGAIVLVSGDRAAGLRSWLRIPRLQLALLVAMAPATLLFFQGASLLAPLVNAIGIPLFALLLPGLMLATMTALAGAGATALWPAAEVLQGLRVALGFLAEVAAPLWVQAAPSGWTVAAAAMGAVLLLTPQAPMLRALGLLCWLPLLWPSPKLPQGQFELALLDVGQGLAAVVRTRHHSLVFDAGPAWPGGFDAGEAIVVPWLRHRGVAQIDRLIGSHAHADHTGGLPAVASAFPVTQRLGADQGEGCARGQHWHWDGVDFDVLHPAEGAAWKGNNRSCVLRIAAGGQVALLTGDIEAVAEASLLGDHPSRTLRANVVLAPHHGSSTSSSPAFVADTAPELLLVPAGWRNRHGHPAPQVLQRWRRAGANTVVTGHAGTLWLRLGRGADDAIELRRARDAQRIWRHPPTLPRRER